MTGFSLAYTEDAQVEKIIGKLIESQEQLPEAEQTWGALFDNATMTYDESMTEFTLDNLHTLVRPKVESTAMRKKKNGGSIRAQKGDFPCKCSGCGEQCGVPPPPHRRCSIIHTIIHKWR